MNNKNQILPEFLELRENLTGDYTSIFVAQDLEANTLIMAFTAKTIFAQPNRYTVQIDDEQHVALNPNYLKYINHSCSPNVRFDTTKMELWTIQSIQKGEELAFFYPSTEWKMTEPFDCLCENDNCLGQISGAAFLSKEILQEYQLSDFIKKKRHYGKKYG